ncbi:MAG: hypothetical protein KTR25_14140 [Myxococcales bacterium]|nr:hypothetical protein [Myxococcales bacterium]
MRYSDQMGRALAHVIQHASPGATIELAPGRYLGPITIDRELTIRGAGDLSRIVCSPVGGSVIRVRTLEPVRLESLRLEGGFASCGGGLNIQGGDVCLINLHLRDCVADQDGGAVYVGRGVVKGERIRIYAAHARRGGAIAVNGESSRLTLFNSQIQNVEAERGGATWMAGAAQVRFEGLTIDKARASTSDGGQAFCVSGHQGAKLELIRVRFGDKPIGQPIANRLASPTPIVVERCDLPRWVQSTPGLQVRGETRWR